MSSDFDATESDDVCRDFLNGICKRRNCKFKHPEDASQDSEEDGLVCRDFLRNVCKRANCKFRHPKGNERVKLTKRASYTFCHDYSNESCKRRDCRFLHATMEEENYFNETGILPPHLKAQVAVGFGSTDSAIVDGDKPLCRDYLIGKCDRGSRCKFDHSGPIRRGGPIMEARYRFNGDIISSRNPYSSMASERSYEERFYDDPYEVSYPPFKRRALDQYDEPYYRRNDMILEEENNMLRRKVEDLKKQIGDLTAANDVLLEQNARLRVSKVNSLTAMTMTTPSAVVSVTPTVTPIVTSTVAVPSAPVNAAATLSALTASISQQVALNSEVVQHAIQQQLVQEVAMGSPHTSLAAVASINSLTPAMSIMSQPALVSAPYVRN